MATTDQTSGRTDIIDLTYESQILLSMRNDIDIIKQGIKDLIVSYLYCDSNWSHSSDPDQVVRTTLNLPDLKSVYRMDYLFDRLKIQLKEILKGTPVHKWHVFDVNIILTSINDRVSTCAVITSMGDYRMLDWERSHHEQINHESGELIHKIG